MTPVEQQFQTLQSMATCTNASLRRLPSGAHLVTVPDVKLTSGWNRDAATLYFVAPPGFPAAKPDCFWLGPGSVRLAGNGVPQNSNEANPVPEVGNVGTWFSWHLQSWNPNTDSLVTFFNVIMKRLRPAR